MFNLLRKKILLSVEVRKLERLRKDLRTPAEILDMEFKMKNRIEEIKRINGNLNDDQKVEIKILESNIELIKWLRK